MCHDRLTRALLTRRRPLTTTISAPDRLYQPFHFSSPSNGQTRSRVTVKDKHVSFKDLKEGIILSEPQPLEFNSN